MIDSRQKFLAADVAIAIPTYGRDQVLLDTISACLALEEPAGEMLIIDQTPAHEQETESALTVLEETRQIRWIRLSRPSIPRAMNQALNATQKPLVLFLDDDVVPSATLVQSHVDAHNSCDPTAVVGQIIQPWQEPCDLAPPVSRHTLTVDFDFPFHTTQTSWLQNCMAGNLCVRRNEALQIGGFDENFEGVAYRFETNFARRLMRSGGRILFCPAASLRHLRVSRGGTRIHGDHLASASPHHGVGDYYFAMCEGWTLQSTAYMLRRLIREVTTRFHLRHPWYVPVKLLGELRAIGWAFQLQRRGPALLPRLASTDAPIRCNVEDTPTMQVAE